MPEPVAPAPRPYNGLAADARREQRRSRLVAAAVDLVGDVGVRGLTVGEVARRAGVSKRYFYESFDSLDTLVGAALRTVFDAVGRTIDAADLDDGSSSAELVDVAVRAALDALDDPRTSRLYLEAGSTPAGLAERDRATQAFVDQMLAHVVDDPADPDAQLLGHLVVAGVTHVVTLWLRGELELDRDGLVRRLTDVGLLAAHQLRGS